ncbi:hypothetical protein LINPERPRIM_LOCUS29650 [Linum perenne]
MWRFSPDFLLRDVLFL